MRSGWPVAQKSAAVRRSHGQLFANAVRTIKAAGSKLQGNTSFPISHCSQCLPWETVRNTDAEVIEHLAKFSTFKIQFQTIGLHPLLVTGIESAGFTAMSHIQSRSLGPAICGHDILAVANNATGTSSAFMLATIQSVFNHKQEAGYFKPLFDNYYLKSAPKALWIEPTRELCGATANVHGRLGAALSASVSVGVLGGRDQIVNRDMSPSDSIPDILISTASYLSNALETGKIAFDQVRVIVLADFRFLAEPSQRNQVQKLLTKIFALSAKAGRERPQLLLHATEFTNEISQFSRALLGNDLSAFLAPTVLVPPRLAHGARPLVQVARLNSTTLDLEELAYTFQENKLTRHTSTTPATGMLILASYYRLTEVVSRLAPLLPIAVCRSYRRDDSAYYAKNVKNLTEFVCEPSSPSATPSTGVANVAVAYNTNDIDDDRPLIIVSTDWVRLHDNLERLIWRRAAQDVGVGPAGTEQGYIGRILLLTINNGHSCDVEAMEGTLGLKSSEITLEQLQNWPEAPA